MAINVRSKRITIAAAALTVALAAPFTTVVTPAALAEPVVATSASDFDQAYLVRLPNKAKQGEVEGLKLNPGDTIAANYTLSPFASDYRVYWNQWGVSADSEGNITAARPTDSQWAADLQSGTVAVPVRVTPKDGAAYTVYLKLELSEQEAPASEEPTETSTSEAPTPEAPTEESSEPTTEATETPTEETSEPTTTEAEPEPTPTEAETSTTPETSAPESSTSSETTPSRLSTVPATTTPESTTPTTPATPDASKFDLDKRHDAENFWGKDTVTLTDAKLNPGDKITSTYWSPLHRWGVEVEADGTLKITRPSSSISFNNAKSAGFATIPVTITPQNGQPYSGDLKVNIVDEMPPATWESELPDFNKTYTVDFEKQRNKIVPGATLPEGVKVERSGLSNPLWTFENINGQLQVNAPATFTPGVFELPVKISDGISTVERTIKINASNPQTTGGDIASGIGGVLGPLIGGLVGGATGGSGGIGGTIGNIIGGLLGGGSGSGEGGGGLVDKLKGALQGLVNVTVEDGAVRIENNGNNNGNVTITDNAKVENNGNNNGNPSVVITDNAKVENVGNDSGNNNGNPSVVITGNANPTIKDNLSNNGNPVITNNANPDVVITGNANPTIKDNLSNNGNPVITGNANPDVVITGNANPTIKDNLSNNANPSNNGNPVITGNANPVITGNANPDIKGIPLSSGGGSSKKDEGKGDKANGSSNLGASVGTEGGPSDPRCIATLVGLGVPLLALIPLALASQTNIPGIPTEGLNNTLHDAARNLGVDPATLTAVGGGIAGVALTLLIIAGIQSCVPEVKEIKIGSSNPAPLTTVAPVITTATKSD